MNQAAHKFLFTTLLAAHILFTSIFISSGASVQTRKTKATMRCTSTALRAMKPLPELDYLCEDRDDDSLKSPERKQALREQMQGLERFTSPEWWAADTEELNVCAALNKPQVISRDKYIAEGYPIDIYGDAHTRLVITSDPCVKYSYGTLNAFVLQHTATQVVVTQVLDGYFSRADNAVRMSITDRGGKRLLEVQVGSGGLHPESESFHFVIDPKTSRAVPRRRTKVGKR
jgi:hypothetical protein